MVMEELLEGRPFVTEIDEEIIFEQLRKMRYGASYLQAAI